MRQSELETVQENYNQKYAEIKATAERADIYTTLLVNGVITIMKGGVKKCFSNLSKNMKDNDCRDLEPKHLKNSIKA